MGHIPFRRCVSCRRAAPKADLVRVAVAGGTVVVDPCSRQPGRGAYICRDRACLDAALRRGATRLLRALRRRSGRVTVEEDEIRQQWDEVATAPGRDRRQETTRGSHHDDQTVVRTTVTTLVRATTTGGHTSWLQPPRSNNS